MKKLRIISVLMMVVALILYLQQSIYAQSGTVTVSYTPSLNYSLVVNVSGNGRVIDGSQSIRNGIIQYDFLEPTQKQFYIQPDTGYQITRLDYETKSVVTSLYDQLVNHAICIDVEDGFSILYVEFEKNPGADQPTPPSDVDRPVSPGSGTSNPGVNTGDNTQFEYMWVLLVSLAGFILVYTKDKSRKELCRDTYNR